MANAPQTCCLAAGDAPGVTRTTSRPASMSDRRPRSLVVALILLSFTVHCVGDGLREDELECERAAVHIAECCPGTRSIGWACGYIDGEACVAAPVDPILNARQAKCLQTASCERIVGAGVCEAVTGTVATGAAGRAGAGGASGGGGSGVSFPSFDEEGDFEPLERRKLREALERRTVCR